MANGEDRDFYFKFLFVLIGIVTLIILVGAVTFAVTRVP